MDAIIGFVALFLFYWFACWIAPHIITFFLVNAAEKPTQQPKHRKPNRIDVNI